MARIIVVDDDCIFRTFVEAVLERNGHEVLTVGVARHVVRGAREHLMRSSFDLAIVDILMPEVSGIEVIRTLKETYRRAKILAITGGGADAGVESRLKLAKKCGADATLAKPFASVDLCRAVDQTLGLGRSRRGERSRQSGRSRQIKRSTQHVEG